MKHSLNNAAANQCVGKRRHSTKLGAIIEAKRAHETGLTAYPCSFCGGWHCGHAIGAVAKREFQGIRRRRESR